jgi:threonylcarbamoyladenosine tRNA methylthiotransferase MtaB
MSVDVITFGCRLNTYESEVMKKHASDAGLSDTIIFNTCAVTAQAEKQARQAIRKARREHPEKRIVVTGCAAQIKPESFAEMGEVDFVLGNAEKMEAGEWEKVVPSLRGQQAEAIQQSKTGSPRFARDDVFLNATEKSRVNDIMSVKETASHMVASFDGRARAFIQVQNGCDHRCTFCIIPFGRGNSRSVPMGEVVNQVRALVEGGYNEIVFTGVDVSAYGADLPGSPTLGQMMRRVLAAVPELKRLRLSSIDAVEVDDDLYRLIAEEPRLMPHLHVSLQAGDDMVLKRMKRRHLRGDIIDFCARVRAMRPDMVFGADIIAGFPTEDDEMFENTRALIGKVGLTYLHVFPYSARAGTPAAKMPQVPSAIRKERASILRAEGERQVAVYYQSLVGKTLEVIVEQDGKTGHAEGFALVRLPQKMPVGSLQRVSIARADGEVVYAA